MREGPRSFRDRGVTGWRSGERCLAAAMVFGTEPSRSGGYPRSPGTTHSSSRRTATAGFKPKGSGAMPSAMCMASSR